MTTRKPAPTSVRTVERRPPAGVLDGLSKAIIEQLQDDGRQSYATIAKSVGLSEAAVRQRVQRLLDGGRHADRGGHRPVAGRLPRGRR